MLKKKFLKAIRFLIFFAIGVVIFWLIYKDQDLGRITNILKHKVNYSWVWFSLFLGLLSHISRSIRWNLMIEPLGHKPWIFNTFLAVMVGYLMNLALPRMGEISRCGVLSRYEKISFTKLVGTVVAERIIDVLMLLLLTLLVIITQFGEVLRFLYKNPEIENKIVSLVQSPILYGAIIMVIILFYVYRKNLKRSIFFKKIEGTVNNFKEGLNSIKKIKRKWAFILHSVFIWLMYYLMLYVVFFAFDFTKALSPLAGLTTFVLASFGMVAPVQGGIGAWHFMVKEALSLYGVANENGVIFALLDHTAMTAMLIFLGLGSLLILPFINRKKNGML
ncbi:Putative dolichol-P-glucose synthetase [hydrothermal vent metagenome]|uniref:Dolichol-P-glucose synthetase n=1 Tax=hydrothermal vent metagenome TaxID=652676 RepID=A0A3B0UWH1_9ZZZZ